MRGENTVFVQTSVWVLVVSPVHEMRKVQDVDSGLTDTKLQTPRKID